VHELSRLAAIAFCGLVIGTSAIALVARADPSEDAPGTSAAGSDYVAAKKAVDAKDWKSAIRLLNKALLQDDRNPDIQNLLGYAYRNTGNFDFAFKHYNRALELNPRHRGAHEYMGEAYLLLNNIAKAEEHLAALQSICLVSCEEYEDLKREIAKYRRHVGK
jgi:Flp pilus assembly protein TadD